MANEEFRRRAPVCLSAATCDAASAPASSAPPAGKAIPMVHCNAMAWTDEECKVLAALAGPVTGCDWHNRGGRGGGHAGADWH